jgi:antitoxin component of MazEF toxin-antitoxin module
MKAVQKIVRQGNSAMVSIPRPLMFATDMLPGELVIWTLLEDKTLHLRPWRDHEFAQNRTPGIRPLTTGKETP